MQETKGAVPAFSLQKSITKQLLRPAFPVAHQTLNNNKEEEEMDV
jgi:hypothetical protein